MPGVDYNTFMLGGRLISPPKISACSCPIFKKSDSMVFYGAKELTCQILSKSEKKHGSCGSSKKIGTRDSSRIRDKEHKAQNGPNQKIFFSKLIEKSETNKYNKIK